MTGPADRRDDGGRLAALLLLAGVVVSFGFGALHPGEADPNDPAAAFAEYARSDVWTGVHLGQFVGMAALIAGLLVVAFSAGAGPGRLAWTARFGGWAAAGFPGRWATSWDCPGPPTWSRADHRSRRVLGQQRGANIGRHSAHPGLDGLAAGGLAAAGIASGPASPCA